MRVKVVILIDRRDVQRLGTRLSVSPLPGGKSREALHLLLSGQAQSACTPKVVFSGTERRRACVPAEPSVSMTKRSKIDAAPGQNRRSRVRLARGSVLTGRAGNEPPKCPWLPGGPV
jgi:hypothetical protein